MNTDVTKADNVTYSDFIYLINPNRKILGQIWGLILNLFFFLLPILNIYFFYKYFNSFFLKVKKNAVSNTERQTTTKRDRRYKGGYRVEGMRYYTSFKHDKENPYSLLSDSDKRFFRLWKILIGLPLLIIGFFAIVIFFVEGSEGYYYPYFVGELIVGGIISFFVSKPKNKYKKSFQKEPTSNFDEKSLNENDIPYKFDISKVDFKFLNSLKEQPEKLKKLKFFVRKWGHENNTYVYKGEYLGQIKSESGIIESQIKAPESGYFEKIVDVNDEIKDGYIVCLIKDSKPLTEYDTSFRLLKTTKADGCEYFFFKTSTLDSLILKKEKDGFTKITNISPVHHFKLRSNNSEVKVRLKFFKEDNFYIDIEFYKKHYNVKSGDKLLFLFENDEIVEIVFSNNSERIRKESDGVIYGNQEEIPLETIDFLQKNPIRQWRLELNKNEYITGKISNSFQKNRIQRKIMTSIVCLKELSSNPSS